MILEILAVIAPVLVIIGLGWIWARARMPFDSPTIGNLVLRIGTPCLIFSTLTGSETALDEMGRMVLAAVAVIALAMLIGMAVLRLVGLPWHTYLLAAMHGNSGNMGLPLAAMAFGVEGLALAIAYFTVVSISQNSLGLVVSAGKFDAGDLLRQPVIHAAAITVAVLLLDLPVPGWLARTTELLGGIVIPAMLILLGVALAQLTVRDLRLALGISALRFGAGAVAALAVIFGLGLGGTEAGVVWIISVMPVAAMQIVFAERYGRSPERIAGVIVVSTLLTLLGLPLVVAAAWWLAGVG